MAPEMYEEHYDEAVDVYAFGMCMLEMATSEYPYNECSGPAQIYKKVTSGIKPASFDKIDNLEVTEIIERCIRLKKEERPNCSELLKFDFFCEVAGITLEPEPLSKDNFLQKNEATKIEFRLRMDPKRKAVKTHKENEAIQFDFDIFADDFEEIANDMYKSGLILEEDSRAVAKLLKVQVNTLLKDRKEREAAANAQKLAKLLEVEHQNKIQQQQQMLLQQQAQQQVQQAQQQQNLAQSQQNVQQQIPMQQQQQPQQQQVPVQPNMAPQQPQQVNLNQQQTSQQQQQQPTQQVSTPKPPQQQPQAPIQNQQMQMNTQQQQQLQPVAVTQQQIQQQQQSQIQQQQVQIQLQQAQIQHQQQQMQQMQQQQQVKDNANLLQQQQQPLPTMISQQQQPPQTVPISQTPTQPSMQDPTKTANATASVTPQPSQSIPLNTQKASMGDSAIGSGASTPTSGGTQIKKRRSQKSERYPKLVVLKLVEEKIVECEMEVKPKTVTFKFDVYEVNPVEVANDLVSIFALLI